MLSLSLSIYLFLVVLIGQWGRRGEAPKNIAPPSMRSTHSGATLLLLHLPRHPCRHIPKVLTTTTYTFLGVI
jgi:hypothetical protein